MIDVDLKWVDFSSAEYDKSVELRDEILRKPLGMIFNEKQLAEEKNQHHLTAWIKNEIVGCLVLKVENNLEIQMRQVAVAKYQQGRGIGSDMVTESENKAKQLGYRLMFLHARDLAVPFYKKLNYDINGEPFEEVGIQHFNMIKNL